MQAEATETVQALGRQRLCQLVQLPRSSLYYTPADRSASEAESARLVEAVEQIALEMPGYGYRRVTAQLERGGWLVNHKRVLQIMRRESLLCRLKKRWVKTTDSEHGLKVYPNLVKKLCVEHLNQVWVADITYVRLGCGGFCYLAAVLDACSRRVVGWQVGKEIDASLAVAALEKALASRGPAAGLIHHSDRGVQYACRGYVERLEAAGAKVSMSAKAKPRDNAKAESFFRTLKVEEVYLQDYSDFEQAKSCLESFIDNVYNRKRLHSSLGYMPPAEYEDKLHKANSLTRP